MASFTTRVELHGAITQQDYANLHAAMERQGFTRLIQSDQGTWYHLPTAEYNYEGSGTVEQVLNAASAAASSTGCSHSILVSEATRRMWLNLAPARHPAHA